MKNLFTFGLAIILFSLFGLGCNNLFVERTYEVNGSNNSATREPDNRTPDNMQSPDKDSTAGDNSAATAPSGLKTISGGVLNGKATNLVKPPYPPAAKAVRASGAVNVQVTIDESGDVISAEAVSGHPLLKASAVQAARQSKFSPTLLSGKPVKVTGIIVYNFNPE